MGVILLMAVFCLAGQKTPERPETWAVPLEMEGVPNFHQVSDTLYRSAQPTAEGMAGLYAMGIRTVVNLRSYHSDRDEIGNMNLGYEHLTMKAWHPEEEEIIRFLEIVMDPKKAPVLVHCQHGADRTGTMVAAYRVVIQGWTKEEAIREMIEGGYGYHSVWKNLPHWIRRLDVQKIKEKLGMGDRGGRR